ncbi:hypothetical protein CONLIGDRAFT_695311 [Coniochaeta ligniaria NRRL 30616]|uniref:2EXR domain-containing protein n=1 Tax=Coniochaeta ligniaria NRRL 30616 TaxID=1408157 RepID=A0A1J7J0J3_9PEZI|nr:hypothetical protein CONLIGDRAFT_695311 [Coniochaeta ligniaria NRRL 30616]
MTPLQRCFPQFGRLPPELRTMVWREARPRPGIHIFDVCMPSVENNGRSARAFASANDDSEEHRARFDKYKNNVFLDALEIAQPPNLTQPLRALSRTVPHVFAADPSMYIVDSAIRASCAEAASSILPLPGNERPLEPENQNTIFTSSVNSVYLPGKDKWIQYDNTTDVLSLRFGAASPARDTTSHDGEVDYRAFDSGISDLLSDNWSAELSETLRNARRIAIDVAETAFAVDVQDYIYQEVAFLCCCIQQSLEVLYLVDHGACQCRACWKERLVMSCGEDGGKEQEDSVNHTDSVSGRRQPDVVYGAGIAYQEMADMDSVEWDENNSAFLFLSMFDEAIRSQQGDDACFQGIRILACRQDGCGQVSCSRLHGKL